jgi:hypothetical protein
MLRLGARYRSQVCTTEIIVVRAPTTEIDLRCGGQPVIVASTLAGTVRPEDADESLLAGTAIGKRYADGGLEVLAVKAGKGSLTADGRLLTIKASKPLPSSD